MTYDCIWEAIVWFGSLEACQHNRPKGFTTALWKLSSQCAPAVIHLDFPAIWVCRTAKQYQYGRCIYCFNMPL